MKQKPDWRNLFVGEQVWAIGPDAGVICRSQIIDNNNYLSWLFF